ncbi:AAA family ATPase [Aurantiacibacter spongiae]|uniref:ATP-binding protein n=1 Tax=Aurantiacibacter spongiae TaxID=2488860 RepID=A0A3N5CNY7_9SPHN|nr:ATP-binding protein [Aurantiacibacter spongiae]RPF70683.1 ATP-binding protein [Aurantiacibacter spongiae]
MLLEFELENEGSFADSSTLSLIASKLKEESEGSVRRIGPPAELDVLTSAIVLGKNGSGKSSFIDALKFVGQFVRSSAIDDGADAVLPYDPNLLMEGFDEKPTFFRVLFSVAGVVYNFGFSHDAEKIMEEFLEVADKSSRFRKLYERNWSEELSEYEYSFGEALTGTRRVWADNTRKNALYLSTANQLNSQDLKEPYTWLTKFLRNASIGTTGKRYTIVRCREEKAFREKVVSFLQSMDVNVVDLEFREDEFDDTVLEKTFSREFLEKMKDQIGPRKDEKNYQVFFKKKTDTGDITEFPLSRESTGTRALFCLAGPLFDVLENGYCLLVDELNTSLHPLVVKFLIEIFGDEKINKKNAQLLFTSHDVSVLRESVLRRDQVWFIEHDGTSSLIVPLSDYSPRKKEALEKGYLSGRYGGVPAVATTFLRYLA